MISQANLAEQMEKNHKLRNARTNRLLIIPVNLGAMANSILGMLRRASRNERHLQHMGGRRAAMVG